MHCNVVDPQLLGEIQPFAIHQIAVTFELTMVFYKSFQFRMSFKSWNKFKQSAYKLKLLRVLGF